VERDEGLKALQEAYKAVHAFEYDRAIPLLEIGLVRFPEHRDATQVLGSLLFQRGDPRALGLLLRAVELGQYAHPHDVANLVEALRATGTPESLADAHVVAERALRLHPRHQDLLNNVAALHIDSGNFAAAGELHARICNLPGRSGFDVQPCVKSAELLVDGNQFARAIALTSHWANIYPHSPTLHFLKGLALHHQEQYEDALVFYAHALEMDPQQPAVLINLGAAYQSLGLVNEAFDTYTRALYYTPRDPGLLNNIGSLLGIMGKEAHGVAYLERALDVDPTIYHALINLASFYQDEGRLFKADEMNRRARALTGSVLFQLRSALNLSPVSESWAQVVLERFRLHACMCHLLNQTEIPSEALGSVLDRTHFYMQYSGLSDRPLQELVTAVQRQMIHNVVDVAKSADPLLEHMQHLRHSPPLAKSRNSTSGKVRVGFFSKFFGLFEPHGLLLDGIMRYLPRSHFQVLGLAVARTDGKPISPPLRAACDEV
jgi:tetratricopeptide (TPR) repeat protein